MVTDDVIIKWNRQANDCHKLSSYVNKTIQNAL